MKEPLFFCCTSSLNHCSEDQHNIASWAWPMEHLGDICLQYWLFCEAETQGLSSTWSFASFPQPLPSNVEGKQELPEEESKLQIHSVCIAAVTFFLPLLYPQRCCVDVSLTSADFPVNVLMLVQGLQALICTVATPNGASVIVWCAFSVIKRNDFPRPCTMCVV